MNSERYLPFEEKIIELDKQIAELEKLQKNIDYSTDICKIRRRKIRELSKIYSNLTAWQVVQVSRHPERPALCDYLELMVKDFRELHGDRSFGDDRAIITGLGQIARQKVLIVGSNKGKKVKEKIACNFGMSHPEGYRKALSKMKLAEKFNIPIVTLIDTPGAAADTGAEERGQVRAIAVNLREMSRLKTSIISIVIGEGGSGGAIGIGVADRLAMLEFSYFSVISPEGCAAILWRDGSKAAEAAQSLKLTSKDLLKLGLIDTVIPEPLGGAHRNIHDTIHNVEKYIFNTLSELKRLPIDVLVERRYQKLRSIGKI